MPRVPSRYNLPISPQWYAGGTPRIGGAIALVIDMDESLAYTKLRVEQAQRWRKPVEQMRQMRDDLAAGDPDPALHALKVQMMWKLVYDEALSMDSEAQKTRQTLMAQYGVDPLLPERRGKRLTRTKRFERDSLLQYWDIMHAMRDHLVTALNLSLDQGGWTSLSATQSVMDAYIETVEYLPYLLVQRTVAPLYPEQSEKIVLDVAALIRSRTELLGMSGGRIRYALENSPEIEDDYLLQVPTYVFESTREGSTGNNLGDLRNTVNNAIARQRPQPKASGDRRVSQADNIASKFRQLEQLRIKHRDELGMLSEREREIYLMDQAGFRDRQIGQHCGIAIGTVKSALYRARSKVVRSTASQ